MNLKRRGFVRNGGLAFGGTLLFRPHVLATPSTVTSAEAPILDSTDIGILQWVEGYSHRCYVHGAGIAGKLSPGSRRETRVIAEIVNYHQFIEVLLDEDGLPAKQVHSHGNHLSFFHRDTFFSIENLEAQDFRNRVGSLTAGMTPDCYDHELLQFRPDENLLLDPRSTAKKGEATTISLRPIANESSVALANWSQVFRGLRQKESFQLSANAAFLSLLESSLSEPIRNRDEAEAFVEAVVKYAASLANEGGGLWLNRVLESTAGASAFSFASRRSSLAIVRAYQSLRSREKAETSDGALWLAALLGGEPDQGLCHRALWIDPIDPVAAIENAAVLSDARRLMAQPGFDSLLTRSGASRGQARTFALWSSASKGEPAPVENSSKGIRADTDGDGVPDLVEYGLGTDPLVMTTTGLPEIRRESREGEDVLALYYIRDARLADILYEVQRSRNLKDGWTSQGVTDVALSDWQPHEAEPGLVRHRATVPLNGTSSYLRLAVRRRF